jgi:hypothetical protein
LGICFVSTQRHGDGILIVSNNKSNNKKDDIYLAPMDEARTDNKLCYDINKMDYWLAKNRE